MEKVIVQETDKDILEVLEAALLLEGFDVYAIRSFNENFLDYINATRPHVVVLDYKIDGQECVCMCKKIKNKYPHLPVVALSFNINIHEVYNRDGFDDYIRKPFDLDLLYTVLKKHVIAPTN